MPWRDTAYNDGDTVLLIDPTGVLRCRVEHTANQVLGAVFGKRPPTVCEFNDAPPQ